MGDFLSAYGASILAGLTIPGLIALGYSFRDALIRSFWELSAEHVRRLIPAQAETEEEEGSGTLIRHGRQSYRVSLDGRWRELQFGGPHMPEIFLRLVDVGADYVELKDVSGEQQVVYPFEGAEAVEGAEKTFRIEANREIGGRGKLIAFGGSTMGGLRGVCTVLVHAENASEKDGSATVVVEYLAGEPEESYSFGLV